jgi:hypothetical protein
MVLSFQVSGIGIGQEASTADKPGLAINRHISGFAAGTKNLKTVEIIRNGEVIKTFKPVNSYSLEFEFDDLTDISKTLLNGDKKPPFVFYYIRVTQEDGHMAWASPIWIDYVKLTPQERKAKRMQRGPIKPQVLKEESDLDFDLDEEDEDELEDDDVDDDYDEDEA